MLPGHNSNKLNQSCSLILSPLNSNFFVPERYCSDLARSNTVIAVFFKADEYMCCNEAGIYASNVLLCLFPPALLILQTQAPSHFIKEMMLWSLNKILLLKIVAESIWVDLFVTIMSIKANILCQLLWIADPFPKKTILFYCTI